MSIERDIEEQFDREVADISKANLMVVGGTGVGKSSLVNRVFGKKLAAVGAGEPVTRGCQKYESENVPVVIFDTEGYEVSEGGDKNNSNFQKVVIGEIRRRETLALQHHIHLYWYCISAANHRITDYDIENIKALCQRQADLAIVITQCDSEELNDQDEGVTSLELKAVLRNAGIKNKVFETSATLEAKLELDKLIEWSTESLPTEKLKDAFVGAQRSNMELKDRKADEAILIAAGLAATAGGVNPIPISDALVIAPIQMALAARLAQIYGFNALGESFVSLLKAQVVNLIGKQVAASLTKLIPIFGQIINAATAGALTTGLGYALKYIYRAAYEEALVTGKAPNWSVLFGNLDVLSFIKKYASK